MLISKFVMTAYSLRAILPNFVGVAALSFAVLSGFSTSGFAQDPKATYVRANFGTLLKLIEVKSWKDAAIIAKVLDLPSPKLRLHQRYAEARFWLHKANCQKAGSIGQSIITDAELFLPAYKIVAVCLVRENRRNSASNLYRRLANILPDGPERDLIEAEAAALAPDMSVFYSFDFNIQPSTNVNRATSASRIGNFNINKSSQGKSGILASGTLKLTKPVFSSDRLISRVSIRAGAGYDSVSRNFFPIIGLESRTDLLLDRKSSVHVTPFVTHTFFEGRSHVNQFGLSFGIAHKTDSSSLIALDNSITSIKHYSGERDGYYAQSTLSWSKPITRFDRASASITLAKNHSENDNYSYKAVSLDAEWEHYFKNNFITSIGGQASFKNYAANAILSDEKREAKRASLILGLSHRKFKIGTLRPEITYTYTKQWSNDVFFQYDAHDIGLRVKASF